MDSLTDLFKPAAEVQVDNFSRFIVDRLDERSTWRGLVFMLTSLGLSLSPELQAAILTVGVAVGGLVEMILPDQGGKMRKEPKGQ